MSERPEAAGACGRLDEPFPEVSRADWRARVERELGEADFESELVGRLPGGLRVEPLYTEAPAGVPLALPASGAGWLRCGACELGAEPIESELTTAADELSAALGGGCDGVVIGAGSAAAVGSLWPRVELGGVAVFLDSSRSPDRGVELATALLARARSGADADRPSLLGLGVDPLDRGPIPGGPIPGGPVPGDPVPGGPVPGTPIAGTPIAGTPITGTAVAADLSALVEALARDPDGRPRVRALAVSSRPLHEAGAHPAQELGWTLAVLAESLRWGGEVGWTVREVAEQVELRMAMERDSFVGLAKLRALRSLWARLLTACGVEAPPPAFVHAFGSQRSLTRRAARLNLVRVAAQSFSAICGGADAVSLPAWDRAAGGASSAGRRLARNTQLVFEQEAHLGRSRDPAAGSYYLETLTDRLARAGWQAMRAIEAGGGAAAHLRSGRLRAEVDAAWQERVDAVRDGGLPIVGVTVFPNPGESVEVLPGQAAGPFPRRRDEDAFDSAAGSEGTA